MEERLERLAVSALAAKGNAYAPYSEFLVGAALLAADGRVFTGCNVENAAYPAGICAERTAFCKAISEGCREFEMLLIAAAPSEQAGSGFCTPCGMCRQFIREFTEPDFPVVTVMTDEAGRPIAYKAYTIEELLPDSFGPETLG